ncbi:MAG TPA: class A beta-lactamase [Allosphingosinicella sp.]|nr:class A beta-lactamase [Allosphingosinicella sp.]
MIDRRTFLAAAAALPVACSGIVVESETNKAAAGEGASESFEAIRAPLGHGARIGVAAIDTGTGRRLLHDADSRYPLASTFKLPLAAMVLAEAERGGLRLDEVLVFAPEDPLDNSPVVAANLARGRLAVEPLAAAIVVRSDNSAANILLRRLGGPEALTRFMRAAGDPATRLDRYEMELGSNLPGDPRDTTTPAAMAGLVRTLVLGDRLSPASRARLGEWLTTSLPGPDRLRAGLPPSWRFGHKTGTAANGGVNDVGIAWPPGRAPIVIASYQSGGDAGLPARAAAHAAVGRVVAEIFG